MTEVFEMLFSHEFFYSLLRVTTPICLAGMAAVVAGVAGVPNIALDGTMLVAAFAGAMVSARWGVGAGLAAAILSGVATAGVLAFFTQYYRCNIIIGGIAINFIASGGTAFLLFAMTGDKGASVSVASAVLPQLTLPIISKIPFLQALSGHNVMTYAAIFSVPMLHFLLRKTTFGRLLRAVGENPEAVRAVGETVPLLRTKALLISGFFCGMAGAFLSMGYLSWFARDMTAGRGWIALCAQGMGGGSFGTGAVTLLFGAADTFANIAGVMGLPYDLVSIFPYSVAMLSLFVFAFFRTKGRGCRR